MRTPFAFIALMCAPVVQAQVTATSVPPVSSPPIPADRPPADAQLQTTRVNVQKLPSSAVTLGRPFGWTEPVPLAMAGTALAISRGRPMSSLPCGVFYDMVDLSMALARGFHLAGYSADALPQGSDRADEMPVLEAIAIDAAGNDATTDLPSAIAIRIRPPVVTLRAEAGMTCGSAYRLSMTLEGPAGIEPFDSARPPEPRR